MGMVDVLSVNFAKRINDVLLSVALFANKMQPGNKCVAPDVLSGLPDGEGSRP